MSDGETVDLLTLVVAISTGLLAWFAVDVGTATLARYRSNFTARTKFQIEEFFLFIDPAKLFVANIAVMALGAVFAWIITDSAFAALPVFLSLTLLPRLLYGLMRRRRLRKFEEQLPDALMMLSGDLLAGLGLGSAIQQVVGEAQAPLAQEFALMLREQRLGVTLEQSLNNLNRRMSTPTTTLVTSAMRVAAETGGGLAETLQRTAQAVRNRLQMEGKIAALTAQGKLQAWVVGLLPMLLMVILTKMEPEAMAMLWHTRIGWATLAAIAFLEFMGVYVIRKIVAIDV